jgi:hypothetical protein
MTADEIGPLAVTLAWVAGGIYFFLRSRSKQTLQKRREKRRADLKARGDKIRGLTSSSRLTATEELADTIAAIEGVHVRGEDLTSKINAATAKNVLQDELGQFADSHLISQYHLEQGTRDTLLAHGREDTAHALVNTNSLMAESKQLHQRIARLESRVTVLILLIFVAERESLSNFVAY